MILARKREKYRAMARAIIDGAAMRVVLDDVRHGRIGDELARRRLVACGVAGKPAEQLIGSFKPKPKPEDRS